MVVGLKFSTSFTLARVAPPLKEISELIELYWYLWYLFPPLSRSRKNCYGLLSRARLGEKSWQTDIFIAAVVKITFCFLQLLLSNLPWKKKFKKDEKKGTYEGFHWFIYLYELFIRFKNSNFGKRKFDLCKSFCNFKLRELFSLQAPIWRARLSMSYTKSYHGIVWDSYTL